MADEKKPWEIAAEQQVTEKKPWEVAAETNQKKSPVQSSTDSTPPVSQPTTPTNYQWSNQEQKTDLATGGVQGENLNPLTGTKENAEDYIWTKSKEKNHALADADIARYDIKTITSNPKIQQAVDLAKQIQEMGTPQSKEDVDKWNGLVNQLNELKKQPVKEEMPGEEWTGFTNNKPSESADILKDKNVGDALDLLNDKTAEYQKNFTTAQDAHNEIGNTTKKLQSMGGFQPGEHGYRQLSVMDNYFNSANKTSNDIVNGLLMLVGDNTSNAELLKRNFVEQQVFQTKPDESKAGYVANLLGGVTPFIPLGIGGEAAGGTIGGLIANSAAMGLAGAGSAGSEAYYQALQQGMNEDEALKTAQSITKAGGALGVIQGAALSALPTKLPADVLGKIMAIGAKNTALAGIFSGSRILENKFAQISGLDRKTLDGAKDAAVSGFVLGSMFDALHLFPEKLTDKSKELFENTLAKYALTDVQNAVSKAKTEGKGNPLEIDKVAQPIIDKGMAYIQMPADLPESVKEKVLPLYQERNRIADEMAEKPDAGFTTRIEQLDREIAEQTGQELSSKEQKQYDALIAKKEETPKEGEKKTPLTTQEKADLKHFEKRIKVADKLAEDAKAEEEKANQESLINSQKQQSDEAEKAKETKEVKPTDLEQKEGAKIVAPTSETPIEKQIPQRRDRHANTSEDEKKLVSGQTDTPLNDKGKSQAKKLGQEYKDEGIKAIIASPLKRAQQTAKLAAKESGAKVETNPNLKTWNLGEKEGGKESDFDEAHYINNPDEKVPGGESFNDFKNRVLKAHEELKNADDNSAVVAHSKVNKMLDAIEASKGDESKIGENYLNGDKANSGKEIESNKEVASQKDFFAKGDEIVNKEIDRVNVLREKQGLKPISKNKNSNENKLFRQSLSDKLEKPTADASQDTGDKKPEGEIGKSVTFTHAGQDTDGKITSINKDGSYQVKGKDGTNYTVKPEDATFPATENAMLGVPFQKEFFKEDVEPLLKKIGNTATSAYTAIRNIVSPVSSVSEKALNLIGKALGDRNLAIAQIDGIVDKIGQMFDKLPEAERIKFIDNLKTGTKQATPELEQVAELLKGLDKDLYDEIVKYKPSLPWKENHFRVIWKTIPGTTKEKFGILSRKPLQGTKGFMKKSTLPDISSGIEKGGVPISTNPITLFKLAYADGMKYITAQRMWDALKKDGFAKFVRFGGEIPEGYVKLDDNIAKVYFPVKEGLVNAGEYYVDEGAARILNNHLGKDYLRSQSGGTTEKAIGTIGRGLMEIKNLYTQAELGLSAFHAVAESIEASTSQIGLGLRKMINLKDFTGGAKDILTSPIAPASIFSTGRTATKYITDENFKNTPLGKSFLEKMPDAEQYVHDFFEGGGILKQAEDYRIKSIQALKEQVGKDNYIGAAIRALPAINDMVLNPLFGHYIPALKVGMFFKEFPVALAENKERIESGKITRQQVARNTVNFIDDRLGEMNFDNLFWNRTFKTAMQLMMRSVTWKLGNIRALGGALPEQGVEFYNAAKEGRAPMLMPKAAWLFGLSAFAVASGTVIMQMLTGKKPETLKDIIAPQIDEKDPNQRVVVPTYFKDVMHFAHSPKEYLSTSLSGVFSKTMDLWNNKDFYNYEIYDPEGTPGEKLKEGGLYLLPKPFSFTSAYQQYQKGQSPGRIGISFLGFQKAPGYLTHTPIENKIFDLYNIRNAGTKPYKEKEGNDEKQKIGNLYRAGKHEEAEREADIAIKEGLLKPKQINKLFHETSNTGNASDYFFKRLPPEDKEYLYSQMNDEEKQRFMTFKYASDKAMEGKPDELNKYIDNWNQKHPKNQIDKNTVLHSIEKAKKK